MKVEKNQIVALLDHLPLSFWGASLNDTLFFSRIE